MFSSVSHDDMVHDQATSNDVGSCNSTSYLRPRGSGSYEIGVHETVALCPGREGS